MGGDNRSWRLTRRGFVSCCGGATAGLAGCAVPFTEDSSADGLDSTDWGTYRRDAGNTGHAPSSATPAENLTLASRQDVQFETDPIIVGDTAVVAGDGQVTALALDEDTLRWQQSVGKVDPQFGGLCTVVGETVYVGGSPLRALDVRDGTERWQFDETTTEASRTIGLEASRLESTPTVADGRVYATYAFFEEGVGSKLALFALDAADGAVAWAYSPDVSPAHTPAVADGTVYTLTTGFTVRALAADTGQQQWEFDPEDRCYSAPVVRDGMVYVGATDGVYAIDAASGDQQWYATAPSSDIVLNAPVATQSSVFFHQHERVVAVDAASGQRRWASDCGTPYGSLAVTDETLYVPANSETVSGLYAFDATEGAVTGVVTPQDGLAPAAPTPVGDELYVAFGHPSDDTSITYEALARVTADQSVETTLPTC